MKKYIISLKVFSLKIYLRILLVVVWSKFLVYKKPQNKVETDGIQITFALSSTTENVTSEELTYAEDEIQKSYERLRKYVKKYSQED